MPSAYGVSRNARPDCTARVAAACASGCMSPGVNRPTPNTAHMARMVSMYVAIAGLMGGGAGGGTAGVYGGGGGCTHSYV